MTPCIYSLDFCMIQEERLHFSRVFVWMCAVHPQTMQVCTQRAERCGRLFYKEGAVSVCEEKYQVCFVRKFVQLKRAQNILVFEKNPFKCVL